ncbi:glycoside hydrolase family 3 protein [Spelaeicoccus albus]|uniref:Beta-N-acetylhexosaminidase n=1 Tax=Spelaeicoccus albus TaxID=1280376 RepID=A0A7Z0IIX4_9MICO|nr:glycoside hydrolase family 3 protein [Spelaeicoccus albus]NYI68945.1 beta-N-acetylhexosaminidase [Spelaeicoccus albus]
MPDSALLRLANSVVWPGFTGHTAPHWLLRELDGGLAGAVYFSHNIDPADPAATASLSRQIHDANPLALIGVDEEGGAVTRLESVGGSSVPGNAVLGRLDDTEVTERAAAWLGRLVGSRGIDIDLAPDVDVNADPRNPVIGVRSFSADPDVVARHAAASVRGLQSAGVAACAKHFPGHGDTASDSHVEAALSDIDERTLREVHLRPFAAAVDAGVKAIMCAHIRVPFLGPAPATVNRRALDLARTMGFDGVIVTDALDMAAIRATIGSGPGAVAALNAGADLLCTGNPYANGAAATDEHADEREFAEVRDAVYRALRRGDLDVARVQEAARRVRELSEWTRRADGGPAVEFDGAAVAARGLEVSGDVRVAGPLLVIDARPRRTIAVGEAADFFTESLRAKSGRGTVERLGLSGMSADDAGAAIDSALARSTGDVVLVVAGLHSDSREAAVRDAVLHARPNAVVVNSGWPGAGTMSGREVRTYGASRVGAEAVADLLLADEPETR